MKQTILTLSLALLAASPVLAQNKKAPKKSDASKPTTTIAAPTADAHAGHDHALEAPQAAPSGSLTPDNMAFSTESHNFGTVAEGPSADYTFTFRNTGKEPIILQKVQPACGCTAADYTKEPILPGKEGFVKASYGTQGRPGPFTKTISVMSNAGAKTLTFTGTVEKAPTSSVPANGSMMRNN